LFKKWHEILSQEGEKAAKMGKIIDEYVSLLRIDPGLPLELIGSDWIGFEAFNIFKEIKGILLA
jgi:DNA-binding transcriptional regulator PaaX